MNYTEIYRKLYDCLNIDNLSHEDVHRCAITITEALSELSLILKSQNPQTVYAVNEIVNTMWNPLNLGGFDLDDKN